MSSNNKSTRYAASLQPPQTPDSIITPAYRHASVVFSNSNATRRVFLNNVGSEVPCRITPLGVDRRWFKPAEQKFESPLLADAGERGRLICTVGRLEDRKGHKAALRAIARVREVYGITDLVYVAVGPVVDGRYAKGVVESASELGVPLVMPGPVSERDLKTLYRLSVCHVLAATLVEGKIEGFGLVLLEAAAQGCPSVATNVGGIPEVIEHCETGFLCEDGDIDTLSESIQSLVADPELRARFAANAVTHARRFTWDACMRATYDGIVT